MSEDMYYDLITSLPWMPHFEHVQNKPITRLRLTQRLKRLSPAHATQLHQAYELVRWRPAAILEGADEEITRRFADLMETDLEPALRDYVEFRIDQQVLMAAVRRKRLGWELPETRNGWGPSARVPVILRNWDSPDFGLMYVYPWLSQARELLDAGDALGLERLLMDVAWRRLTKYAEQNMFAFKAVFSYTFKWDILQAWLSCDAEAGKVRFTKLIDQVTHVESN